MNKFLWLFIILLQINQTYSCNYRVLDAHAETFSGSICSRVPIASQLIYDQLNFLESKDEEEIKKYTQIEKFEALYEQKIEDIKDEGFKKFAQNCKIIYDQFEDIDPVTQAAVHMLFKEVSKKYHEILLMNQAYKIYLQDLSNQEEEQKQDLKRKSQMEQKQDYSKRQRIYPNNSTVVIQ